MIVAVVNKLTVLDAMSKIPDKHDRWAYGGKPKNMMKPRENFQKLIDALKYGYCKVEDAEYLKSLGVEIVEYKDMDIIDWEL